MASSSNKKLSILYILKILQENSDEKHPLTQLEIVKKLYSIYGMECERKSVGASLESLEDFGYDIIKTKQGCYLGSRDFEPSEISFLVDAVFSSKSITSKQAKELATRISHYLSEYERKKFKYIYKSDNITRTDNKQLFYTIDLLNQAIEENKQVLFQYNKYDCSGKLIPRRDGKEYLVNPYFMVNSNGRYYLVCNLNYFDEIANYKIDQISNIKILDSKSKPIKQLKEYENGIDISKYITENVYMFGGKTINAKIHIEIEYTVSNVFEWFGKNAKVYKKDDKIYADIVANELSIIYWCLQYGENVELVEPQETRDKIKEIVDIMKKKYK